MRENMKAALVSARKVNRQLSPWFPWITRALLVATFVEDGIRILVEMPHQVHFLVHEYYVPQFLARVGLVLFVLISFAGVILVLGQNKIARGKYEPLGAYILLGCVLYQQVLYGRHSPISSGNLGYLLRNLCLSGSLLLLTAQKRMSEGRTALPGLPDAGNAAVMHGYLRLASRCMLVLLSLEFLTTLGPWGTVLTLPVIAAVLVGYKINISGSVLIGLYFLHNFLNSPFYAADGEFMKEIMRFEFVQTLSIMGGLMLLVHVGPGEFSVDERSRRKDW